MWDAVRLYGLAAILIAVVFCAFAPVNAQANADNSAQEVALPDDLFGPRPPLWRRILGQKDVGPDPGVTLQAPFINPETLQTPTADQMKLPYSPVKSPESTVQMDRPHRHEEQVAIWVMDTLAAALSVEAGRYAVHLRQLEQVMDRSALAAFDQFMRSTNILSRLEAGDYQLRGLVDEKPFLINQGVVGGHYRWLYEVPVTLSFMPRDVHRRTYEDKKTDPASYKLTITTQVGRAESFSEGMALESWSAKAKP